MRLSWYEIAGLLCLFACNGSGGVGDAGAPLGGSGGAQSPKPQSGLVVGADSNVAPTELARVLCERLRACAAPALGAVTEDECVIYFSQPCSPLSRITAEDGLAECLSNVRAVECNEDTPTEVGLACADAVKRADARLTGLPLQDVAGGACGDGVACTGRRICDGFGNTCGVCRDIPETGESCAELGACWDGHCDARTQVCVALKADGEPCEVGRECKGAGCVANVCTSAEEDVACNDNFDCGGNSRCRAGGCREPVQAGGACTDGDDCISSAFCDDGVCKLVARCTLGELGEPCGASGCARELICFKGLCTAPPVPATPVGTRCHLGQECETGYCGIEEFGDEPDRCAKKPATWSCDADDQCASNSCINFRCNGTTRCVQ